MEKSILFWVEKPNTYLMIFKWLSNKDQLILLCVSVGYYNVINITGKFTKTLAKMTNKFDIWSYRNLTLIGGINNTV